MPLILTAPQGPIRTYKNGVKVIRAEDFIAPARSGLATVSDSLSVCGTVVTDSQQVSYSGSNPDASIIPNVGSADPTLILTDDDLSLSEQYGYQMWIGVRATGECDPTRRNVNHNFVAIGNNTAVVMSRLFRSSDSTESTQAVSSYIPKSQTNPYYKVVYCGGTLFHNFFSEGFDELHIKAFSGTGGDIEIYLDLIYFIPVVDNASNTRYLIGDFRNIGGNETQWDIIYDWKTDTYDPNEDDVATSWDADFSVNNNTTAAFGDGQGETFGDYQEGHEEMTKYNISGQGFYTNYLTNPSSNITAPVGSHYVPDQAVDSDSFSRTGGPDTDLWLGESTEIRNWYVAYNHPMQASGAGSGFELTGSELAFRKQKYDSFSPFLGGNTSDNVVALLGFASTEQGTGSSTQGHEVFSGMDWSIIEIKVAQDFTSLNAGQHIIFGYGTNSSTPSEIEFYGVKIQLDVTGTANCYLTFMHSIADDRTDDVDVDGPVNLGVITPGQYIRMKIEKRHYKYRAKVWLDGGSEPGSWQLEGDVPSNDSIVFPWSSDTDHGYERRSSGSLVHPCVGTRFFGPIEDTEGTPGQPGPGKVIRLVDTFWDDLTVDYQAYGDPEDVFVQMERYDSTFDYGTVRIPFESQRVVISTNARHTFNNDEDGFNISLWKTVGAADSQIAVMSTLYQRRVRGGPIHLALHFRPEQNTGLTSIGGIEGDFGGETGSGGSGGSGPGGGGPGGGGGGGTPPVVDDMVPSETLYPSDTEP